MEITLILQGRTPGEGSPLASQTRQFPSPALFERFGISTSAEVDRPFAGGSRRAFEKARPKPLRIEFMLTLCAVVRFIPRIFLRALSSSYIAPVSYQSGGERRVSYCRDPQSHSFRLPYSEAPPPQAFLLLF